MYAQQQALDVIASNLANASSTGFKSDRLTFREALDRSVYAPGERQPRLLGRLGGGALVEGSAFTPGQGPIVPTSNPLDVSLDGDGYFSVKAPGGTRYTRAGSFQTDAKGRLVTGDGLPVLGKNGEITAPPNQQVQIDEQGNVLAGGKPLDQLAIVTGQMKKEGNGLYTGGGQPVAKPRVRPNSLEGSNVNVVEEMVAMIETTRTFEANQRVVQAHDETLSKAISDLARLS